METIIEGELLAEERVAELLDACNQLTAINGRDLKIRTKQIINRQSQITNA